MGGASSKNKGSDFERQVAKALSLWVNPADGLIFARRSGSGGAGRDKTGGTNHGGDIFADKPEGLFLTDAMCFELKFYADLTPELWKFLAGKSSMIDEFIRQAKESADVYTRAWTLILKCNRRETLLLTTWPINTVVPGTTTINSTARTEPIYLIPFERFLETPVKNFKDVMQQGE